MKAAGPWRRHPSPPWEVDSPATHGLTLEHDDGRRSVVVLEKCRRYERDGYPDGRRRPAGEPRLVWVAFWYPAGAVGFGPHIVTHLFATRRLAAAKALVELWADHPRAEP